MQISVRVTASNSKWTSIQYLSSNAKSRIPTQALLDQMSSGKVRSINPHSIHGYTQLEEEGKEED